MARRQNLGLAGAAVLAVGVFAPAISAPIIGTRNLFQNGQGDGVIILILALASAVIAAAKYYKGL